MIELERRFLIAELVAGREVTDDGRYTNASPARHGWPIEE
jgi:CYTH domain-containing protein